MSEFTELLDRLPVPDHAHDFWARLEADLAAESPTSDPEPIDPRTGTPLVDRGADIVDLAVRHRVRRWILAGTAAAAAVVLLLVLLSGRLTEDSAPGPVVTDPTVPTTTAPPESTITTTTVAPDTSTPPAETETPVLTGPSAAGAALTVSQTTDLVDGSTIRVSGSDFSILGLVAVSQCYGPIVSDGSFEACDVSNYQIAQTTSDGSAVMADLVVHRHIVTAQGEVDCANPEPPNYCMVGAGVLDSLTDYGVVRLTFDVADGAPLAPVIEVSETSVSDGQTITVNGRNFVPGEEVEVHQCVLNSGCPPTHGINTVTAGANGTFTTEAVVFDCGGNPFGCRIGASATRDAFPVVLTFDTGGTSSYELPTVAPSDGLTDGQTVTVDLPRSGALVGETFEARQCLDRHVSEVLEEPCGPPVTGTVGEDGTTFEFTVVEQLDIDFTSFPGCVDRGWGLPNLCHIRVETETFRYQPLDIWFELELEG